MLPWRQFAITLWNIIGLYDFHRTDLVGIYSQEHNIHYISYDVFVLFAVYDFGHCKLKKRSLLLPNLGIRYDF